MFYNCSVSPGGSVPDSKQGQRILERLGELDPTDDHHLCRNSHGNKAYLIEGETHKLR